MSVAIDHDDDHVHHPFLQTPVVTWDAYDYPAMLKAMGETQNV